MSVCGQSWGTLAAGWWFCSLPAGHAGPCSCAGIPRPPDAKSFEDQPDAVAHNAKQVADERRKLAGKSGQQASEE